MTSPVPAQPVRLPGVRVAVAAMLPVAAVTAVLAVALSGAATPTVIADPGAVVRWAGPAVTAAQQLAVATTLGALLLAVTVLPRRVAGGRHGQLAVDGRAWPLSLTVASAAAGVWTLLSLAQVVFVYARTAGRPIGGPTFGGELGLFITSIPLGRAWMAVAVIAAVTTTVSVLVTTATGAAWTAVGVVVALVLQAHTGHAAGSADHELAVSAMMLHLVGAAVWIGAVAALGVLSTRLAADLAPAVRRFSVVAGWCLVMVGVSGLVSAWVRLGGAAGLDSRYGALVAVKVGLFAALGCLGWLHRRWVVARLDDGGAAPARPVLLFWRLAAVEILIMGAVSGVAAGLGVSAPPVPDTPPVERTPAWILTGRELPPEPTLGRWLDQWRPDLVLAFVCAAGLVVYLRWVLRLRRRGDSWPWPRAASWVAGVLLLAWVTNGGPAVYGHVLFSAHMVQHMLLAMVVPIFLALAAPVTLALRALPGRQDASRGPREWLLALVQSRWARFWATPTVAAVNFAGSMVVFYYTPLFELALRNHLGHLAMVVHFTVAGYLFVNALVGVDPGPSRPAYPMRLLLLFATMAFHAFFGIALVSGQTLLAADWFGNMGRDWGLPALDDQRRGGAIAWGIGELPTLALAIGVALAWARDDERLARRQDRAADRDGGAELAAYNEMLGRMSEEDGR